MSELAAAARRDPVEYRLALLGESPRARGVLELAAQQAGWGQPLPAGHGRGVSLLHAFGSYIAQVAEVSASKTGDVRVHRAHRSEEHTSELQSLAYLVCRLLLEKKKNKQASTFYDATTELRL